MADAGGCLDWSIFVHDRPDICIVGYKVGQAQTRSVHVCVGARTGMADASNVAGELIRPEVHLAQIAGGVALGLVVETRLDVVVDALKTVDLAPAGAPTSKVSFKAPTPPGPASYWPRLAAFPRRSTQTDSRRPVTGLPCCL